MTLASGGTVARNLFYGGFSLAPNRERRSRKT